MPGREPQTALQLQLQLQLQLRQLAHTPQRALLQLAAHTTDADAHARQVAGT